jgi:transposase
VTEEDAVGFADEMRVGLHGVTRRVWGRRGVKVVQRLQIRYEWRYLVLAVDGRTGRLWWTWEETMRAEDLLPAVDALKEQTPLAALVWDRAPAHRDERIHALGLPLLEQPPYAPELNPAERVFEHLRARIEGKIYPSLDANHPPAAGTRAVDALLDDLDAHPARVQSLAGWQWIADSLARLPAEKAA